MNSTRTVRTIVLIQPSYRHTESDRDQISAGMATILQVPERKVYILTIGRPVSFVQAVEILGAGVVDVFLYEGYPQDAMVTEYAEAASHGGYPTLMRFVGDDYEQFGGLNAAGKPTWVKLETNPKPTSARPVIIVKRIFQPEESKLSNTTIIEALETILQRLEADIDLKATFGIPLTAETIPDIVDGMVQIRRKDILLYEGRPPLAFLITWEQTKIECEGDFPHLVRILEGGVYEEFIGLDDDGTQHWESLIKRPWVRGYGAKPAAEDLSDMTGGTSHH